MKRLKENIFLVEGNLYTNMNMDVNWLSENPSHNIIHARGDIFFGVLRYPKLMKRGDYYLDFLDFTTKNGPIFDVVMNSKI